MTDADLVVIGPRGKSPLERLLVGSTANALLSAPPSPVLVVRSRGPVRRVIACTDGSPHAAAAIRALAALPLAASASVTLLGVYDDRSPVDDGLAEARSILAEAGIEATTQTEEGMVPGIVLREIDELERRPRRARHPRPHRPAAPLARLHRVRHRPERPLQRPGRQRRRVIRCAAGVGGISIPLPSAEVPNLGNGAWASGIRRRRARATSTPDSCTVVLQ
jgi:hypothetical protein